MSRKNNFEVLEIKKNEGILRNFLFINPIAGKSIRIMKYFIANIVTVIDHFTMKLFGESDIIIVLKKQ